MKECTSCKKNCVNIFNDQTTRIGFHCVLKIDNKIFNEIFLCPQCSLQALSGILLSPQNDLENPTVTITGYHACFDISEHVESIERKAFVEGYLRGSEAWSCDYIPDDPDAITAYEEYKKQGGEG